MSFARKVMLVAWPAFLAAAGAELVFFAIFDPFELHFFGAPLDLSRHAIYAMGFLGFWGLAAVSSTLTLFLAATHAREPAPEPPGTLPPGQGHV